MQSRLLSLLALAVVVALVSPVVTEAKTDVNKSPPSSDSTIVSPAIFDGTDMGIAPEEQVSLTVTSLNSDWTINGLYVTKPEFSVDIGAPPREVARHAGWNTLYSAASGKVFAKPAMNRSHMTGSTDGKSVATPDVVLVGTNPFIVLYVTTAVQRTMIPAMKDCSEAIMRAPRGSARSGPFRDFPFNSHGSKVDLR